MSSATPKLTFTGERYHPEVPREMAYEHWHRYAFVMELARGRQILDAACGEGYGAALLARTAASVLGVDLSAEAIAHATACYAHPRLRFQQGDVRTLDGVAAESIDLVVSFETLEHVAEHEEMLAAFSRVLKPDGLLVLSTPDRHTYSEISGHRNPHHVRELYRHEFAALLQRYFAQHRLYGQRMVAHSLLWRLDDGSGATTAFTQDGDEVFAGLRIQPMYYLAVCAKRNEALAELSALSCFTDAQQSVYAHYQQVIRDLMATDRYAHTLRERLRAAGLSDGP